MYLDTPGPGKMGGVLADSAVRRSTRRKRVRGEKEFTVDSDTLLRDLKVKVSNNRGRGGGGGKWDGRGLLRELAMPDMKKSPWSDCS